MSGTTVGAGENMEETYLRRFFDVLGAKGTVILVSFPIGLGLLSALRDTVQPAVVGGILGVALVFAVLIDRKRDETNSVEAVGVSFLVVSFGYTALLVTGTDFGWPSTFVGSLLVFAAVVYDYAFGSTSTGSGTESLQETDVDPLHIDVVGFVVAQVLLVHSILLATGWGSFANSSTFGALAFLVYTTTTAAFAGYAVVTREVVVSRTSEELHGVLIGVLGDIHDIENDVLREDIASKMRMAADGLDGAKLPTNVKDGYGGVPAVVPERKPDRRCIQESAENIIKTAVDESFTGYIIHDGRVLLFRNGLLIKYYHDGEYGYEIEDIKETIGDATFHSLEHSTLNNLDDITPKEDDVTSPEEAKEEIEKEKQKGKNTEGEGKTLDIGGEEIDMDEMFQKADEIMDDLSE